MKAELPRNASAQRALCAAISDALAQIAANAPGVLSNRDDEYLHQLRVGMRRLRSALRVSRPLLDSATRKDLVCSLRALSPVLGRARDWDVVVHTLIRCATALERRHAGLETLIASARRRRALARRASRQALSSSAFARLMRRAAHWQGANQERGVRLASPQSALEFAGGALERLHRKALRHGASIDLSDARARHALRVRLKRLRYACEFFAGLFTRKPAEQFLDSLRTLQDLLGELNDIAVARRLLGELTSGRGGARLAAGSRRVSGWLLSREQALTGRLDVGWRRLRVAHPYWRAAADRVPAGTRSPARRSSRAR